MQKKLWPRKCGQNCRKDIENAINETLNKERESQERQYRLWKDRPKLARKEIPDKVFRTLQKQHSSWETDSVPRPGG